MADIYDALNDLQRLEDGDEIDNVEKARIAQNLLGVCNDLVEQIVDDTGDENARAYMLDHLRIKENDRHGFLTNDMNFDNLIERLERMDNEDDDDE